MASPPRILVTGGHGFVGCAIVNTLLELHASWTVGVLDIQPSPINGDFPQRIEFLHADILKPAQLEAAVARFQPDVIIHTAGYVPELTERYGRRLEQKCQQINVEGTRNVLAAARAADCRALVHTSSCTVVVDDWENEYPNVNEDWPASDHSSVYGESKAAAERLVISSNDETLKTCVLRPSVIFGEGDTQLLPPIHACISKGETPFRVGDGNNLWDVVYVGNVAYAHVLAVENLLGDQTAAGEVMFVQNNEPITFREFQLAIWRNFGHSPPYEIGIPKNLGWLLGVFTEWISWLFGTTATLTRGSVLDAAATRYARGDKARTMLGYEARVGLEDGLRRSCQVSGSCNNPPQFLLRTSQANGPVRNTAVDYGKPRSSEMAT